MTPDDHGFARAHGSAAGEARAPSDPADSAAPGATDRPVRRLGLTDWVRSPLQILGMVGLAIAQPLLGLFGANPTFFVAHGSRPLEIALFALAVVVVPAAAFIVPVVLVRLVSRRAGDIATAVVVGALATLLFFGVWEQLSDLRVRYWAIIFVAGTAVVAYGFLRVRAIQLFTLYLSFSPVLFVVLFLFTSAVRPLVFENDADVLAASPSDTPLVVVVFDELPLGALLQADGTIDADRFPGFAELAAVSTWYPRATTISTVTHAAIPGLLTGRFPDPKLPPVAGQYQRSLFTMLGRGRQLHVGEVMTSLCPAQLCETQATPAAPSQLARDTAIVAGHEFLPTNLAERWFPDISSTWANFGEDLNSTPLPDDDQGLGFQDWFSRFQSEFSGRSPDAATYLTFLDSLSADEPGLWYQHVMLPHVPYHYLPDGRAYAAPHPSRSQADGWWSDDPLSTVNAQQRLLLQMKYVDSFVSMLIEQLRDEGMLDEAMLVIAGDHGVSMLPGTHFRAHYIDEGASSSTDALNPYDAVVPVPLFVKYPGHQGSKVDDRDASLIDVLPTIVDLFDLPLPDEWSLDGHSLLAAPPSSVEMRLVVDGSEITELSRRPDPVRAAASVETLFGRFRGEHDIYAVGPFADLVGRPVNDVAAPVAGATVAVEQLDSFGAVDLDSDSVPVYLSGAVSGLESGSWVAVALNDTVAGVAPVYLDNEGQTIIEMLVDPTLLQSGANRVTLYLVDAATTGLSPITSG